MTGLLNRAVRPVSLQRLLVASAMSIICASSVSIPAPTSPIHALRPLSANVDVDAPADVFRAVFAALDDEVTVLPSENYFYFATSAGSVAVEGDIALFADNRDDGVVTFGYRVRPPPGQPVEHDAELTARDGVVVRKIDDLNYAVTAGNRTVVFHLNGARTTVPRGATLSTGERFVASTFDESGLQFFLVYSRTCNRLFWVLNDDVPVPDRFDRRAPSIVIGARSGFAFYEDLAHRRRVLIGVRRDSVIRNDAYDGPFDQLPDNEIKAGRVQLQPYLEAAYPLTKGKIDRYGVFVNDRGRRIAIVSYLEYASVDELLRFAAAARSFDCALIDPGSRSARR